MTTCLRPEKGPREHADKPPGIGRALHRAVPLALSLAMPLGAAPVAAAEAPVPFEAQLEFLRNGKLMGESRFTLTVENGDWIMHSQTQGTRGVAKFLGVNEESESRGGWQDGAPRPDQFRQTVKVSFKTIETTAEFDWAAGEVRTVHKKEPFVLPLEPGVLDPVSVGLAVRAGLAAGEREWRLPMVDEDKIETQHFRAEGAERLETTLGCLDTERVDKIRAASSSRYTRTWYARDFQWVPVHVTHGKTDGDHMETRLVALVVDGVAVEAGQRCAEG